MPPKIFKRVDLPLPDGPSKTQNSPFSTFSDKFFNTSIRFVLSPKPLFKSFTYKNINPPVSYN